MRQRVPARAGDCRTPKRPPTPRASPRWRAATWPALPARVVPAGGAMTIVSVDEQPYEPPALPAGGRYSVKGTPVDLRLLQHPLPAGEKPPPRALLVSWHSRSAALFDLAFD